MRPPSQRRPATARRLASSPDEAVDLASRWVGGTVMAASDEAFGEKEHLLAPGDAVSEPGRYGPRGEIVDGWETRRRRRPGVDWVLVRLGTPGVVTAVDVDTSFFTGNHPGTVTVEASGVEGYPGPDDLDGVDWVPLVPRSPLRGDAHNLFGVSDPHRYTHVRLTAEPDGGIARLRVYGRVVPDPRHLDGVGVDLVGRSVGGEVVAATDGFYSSAGVLNRPDRARTMGEGWETRRRRDGLHDAVVLRLGVPGCPRRLEVDTDHFRYNATAEIAVYGSDAYELPATDAPTWTPVLDWTVLQPDTRHSFGLGAGRPLRWLRVDAWPDGGLSRIRAWGTVSAEGRAGAGREFLDTLPDAQAAAVLAAAGVPADLAAAAVAARPVTNGWLEARRRAGPGAAALVDLLDGPRG